MTPWTALFNELRRVYGNVSELLLDADRLLDAEGFDVAHGKQAQIGIERSGAIHEPDSWAPQWMARFYRNRKVPPIEGPLVYVACILADGGAADYNLPEPGEPIVTAGLLRFGAKGTDWSWRYWTAKYWLWTPKTGWPSLIWQIAGNDAHLPALGVHQLETFAVPLRAVSSRHELHERVIKPLLARAGFQKTDESTSK